jgi:hypothetical protein
MATNDSETIPMGYPIIRLLRGTDFSVLPLSVVPNLTGPLVYVLARRERAECAIPLYVDEVGEAKGYLGPNHKKWDEAQRLGMNAVAVHRLADAEKRQDIKTVLREHYRPVLNV